MERGSVHQLTLQIGEQVRTSLCLVDDCAIREKGEEASRIFLGEQTLIRVFKAHIRTATEECLRQCRFPRLPGSDDRDNLEFAGKCLRQFG
jgi:hypothetical protein